MFCSIYNIRKEIQTVFLQTLKITVLNKLKLFNFSKVPFQKKYSDIFIYFNYMLLRKTKNNLNVFDSPFMTASRYSISIIAS